MFANASTNCPIPINRRKVPELLFRVVELPSFDESSGEIEPYRQRLAVERQTTPERSDRVFEVTAQETSIAEIVPALPIGWRRMNDLLERLCSDVGFSEKLGDIPPVARDL